MKIRPFDKTSDLTMLQAWWRIHKANPVPEVLLPRGFIAEDAGVSVAAVFLYMDADAGLAMTEYMTTNPQMSFSRTLLANVRALYAHCEDVAKAAGCRAVVSMVAPNTGEERLMRKIGYVPPDGTPHVMFAKLLVEEISQCP